jgi:uncharacterized membrane protein
MSNFQIALLLHIVGAILYFSGLALTTAALLAARRRERPSEIALLLRLSPYGVALVGVGFIVLLGFGLWLVDLTPAEFDQAWLSAALALFVAAAILGGIGGRKPREARVLATRLAGENDEPSLELRQLLTDPISTALNALAGLASVAILVLMVWRPGS